MIKVDHRWYHISQTILHNIHRLLHRIKSSRYNKYKTRNESAHTEREMTETISWTKEQISVGMRSNVDIYRGFATTVASNPTGIDTGKCRRENDDRI